MRPTSDSPTPATAAAPDPLRSGIDDPAVPAALDDLIQLCGGDPRTGAGQEIRDLLQTGLELIAGPIGTGDRKLLIRSFHEMRHAFAVFAGYPGTRKVSIFGSARTPRNHPDYRTAVEFSRTMASAGWLSITGAGDGIMLAAQEGPGAESSFGLAIHLPFETTANEVIAGDEKLLHFRYFFTRKVMFLSQCHAVVAFPGGFGTQDELLESLTLVQTGKSSIIPIVLMAGADSSYWDDWQRYIRGDLLARGFISPQDADLFHAAGDSRDAVDHIMRFYSTYHSSRYIGDRLVLRIQRPLSPEHLERLNSEFGSIVRTGSIRQGAAHRQDHDHRDLPRISFIHTRDRYAVVRRMIDRINEYGAPPTAPRNPGGRS